MRLVGSFCFLLLLSSCHFDSLSSWFNQQKDSLLTQASQATTSSLTQEDKEELLYLFFDLQDAKSCSHVKSHIETNKALRSFEKSFKLPEGFLFDGLINYDHEASLFKVNRSPPETVVFSIVSVWKTEFSLEEIEELINKVVKCYPDEYL